MQPMAVATKGILSVPYEDECSSDELEAVIDEIEDVTGTIEEC